MMPRPITPTRSGAPAAAPPAGFSVIASPYRGWRKADSTSRRGCGRSGLFRTTSCGGKGARRDPAAAPEHVLTEAALLLETGSKPGRCRKLVRRPRLERGAVAGWRSPTLDLIFMQQLLIALGALALGATLACSDDDGSDVLPNAPPGGSGGGAAVVDAGPGGTGGSAGGAG